MSNALYDIENMLWSNEEPSSTNFGYKIFVLGRHRTEDHIVYMMVEYRKERTIFSFSFKEFHLHQTRWYDGGRVNITKSLKKAVIKHFSSRLGSLSFESITESYW